MIFYLTSMNRNHHCRNILHWWFKNWFWHFIFEFESESVRVRRERDRQTDIDRKKLETINEMTNKRRREKTWTLWTDNVIVYNRKWKNNWNVKNIFLNFESPFSLKAQPIKSTIIKNNFSFNIFSISFKAVLFLLIKTNSSVILLTILNKLHLKQLLRYLTLKWQKQIV